MKISGDYVNIYKPDGDFTANDFSILNDGGVWHMVGITQERAEGFIDDFNYAAIHEQEHQLFHCMANGRLFSEVFRDGSFTDGEKLLYPSERPDEIPEIHAPHLMKYGDGYRMIYGPRDIRRADTRDFKSWDRKVMFSGEHTLRDPFLFYENGLWRLLDTVENRIVFRTSADMENWSEAKTLCENPYAGAPESPFMFKRKGYYYLAWSIYDGRNGCYDERTFVFASETPDCFCGEAPITMLEAHAPEFVSDESGDYILSVFYPYNGISAAKLEWITE
ncbi:MAG: hypothetical protein WCQ72_04690 [Eubacteriales bacterium]